MEINEFPQALKNIEEALLLYRDLVKKTPIAHLPYIATTLNNLAILQQKNNEIPLALKNYQESLQIYRGLAKENPRAYLSRVASILNNLANLQKANNKFPQALKNYEEAIQINKGLAKENPSVYLSRVASILINLGNLQRDTNEFPQALKNYKESLKIFIGLAKENPSVYNIKFARVYILISFLKQKQLKQNFDIKIKNEGLMLIKQGKKALRIYDNTNPNKIKFTKGFDELESFFLSVDESIILFGNLQKDVDNIRKQISDEKKPYKKVKLLKNSIKLITLFSNNYPDNVEAISLLARNLGSLSYLALFDKDYILSESAAKKALNTDPNQQWINTNLVLAYVLQGKYESARNIYIQMKDNPYREATYTKVFIEDIEALEKAGITHKDFEKVKQLLKK